MRKCECGGEIFQRRDSTLQDKKCVRCKIADMKEKKRAKAKEKRVPSMKEKTPHILWQDKPTNKMISYVQTFIVNKYILARDRALWGRCIATGEQINHAGHFYAISNKPGMRLNCQNIHGQSWQSNTVNHGDSVSYRKGLIDRYGERFVQELEIQAMNSEDSLSKDLDRDNIIRYAKTYLYLHNRKIWVTTLEEFNIYLNITDNARIRS